MERVSALEVQLRVYGNSLGILRRGTGRELSEMVLDRRDGNAGALWMNHKQEVCKAGLNICEVESGERNPRSYSGVGWTSFQKYKPGVQIIFS